MRLKKVLDAENADARKQLKHDDLGLRTARHDDERKTHMSRELVINAIGVIAALCSMGSFIPQVAKIVRERDASSVSLRMYIVTVTGFALWTVYGVLLASWPLTGSNLVSLSLAAMILVLKIRYRKSASGDAAPASASAG